MARSFKDHFSIATAAFERDIKKANKKGEYLTQREPSLAEQLLEHGSEEEKRMAREFLAKEKKGDRNV
jgi:hypothetical protein